MRNGKEFEKLLLDNLNILNENEIGYFIQSPTPFRSVPFGESYKLIYSAKALCDFVGIFQGTFFLLEAKVVSGSSFPFDRLKEHQVYQLKRIRDLGGHSFIIFHIKRTNEIFALSIKYYVDFFSNTEKKSIHIKEIKEKGILIGNSEYVDFISLFRKSIKFSDIF